MNDEGEQNMSTEGEQNMSYEGEQNMSNEGEQNMNNEGEHDTNDEEEEAMNDESERDFSGLLSTVRALSEELGLGGGNSLPELGPMMPMLLQIANRLKKSPEAISGLMSLFGGGRDEHFEKQEAAFLEKGKQHCENEEKCKPKFPFFHDFEERGDCCHSEKDESCYACNAFFQSEERKCGRCRDCLCRRCLHKEDCPCRKCLYDGCKEGEHEMPFCHADCDTEDDRPPFRDPLDPRRRNSGDREKCCEGDEACCDNCKQFISTDCDFCHFSEEKCGKNTGEPSPKGTRKFPERGTKFKACRRLPRGDHHGRREEADGCRASARCDNCPSLFGETASCGCSHNEKGSRENLLSAIRPFLPKERQEKLWQVLKIAELFRLFETKGE